MALGDPVVNTILRDLLFLLLAVVGPGLAAQRALRLPVDVALVLPVGLVSCGAAYWLSLVCGQAWVFPLILVAILVAGAVGAARDGLWRRAAGPSLRGAIPPLLACVVVLAATQFRMNRVGANGDFLLDPGEGVDTAFHVGLTWELVSGYPPQVPGLSGFPLRYHFGTHLVRAAATRWAGVHPYDSITRFDLVVWALLLILVLRASAHRLGGSPLAVALAGWIPLAADFSFLLGPWAPGKWWAAIFGSNLLEALFFANSVLPAVALALGVIVSLSRVETGEGGRWALVATGLAAAVPVVKVFVAAHLLVGLVAFGWRTTRHRWWVLAPGIACLLSAWLVTGQHGDGRVVVGLLPGAMPQAARHLWGFSPVSGLALVAWCAVWLVASLGLRLVALIPAVRALFRTGGQAAMAAMGLLGWPAALFLHISGDGHFNEAVYFLTASGPILWLFALGPLSRCLLAPGQRAWLWRVGIGALVFTASVHYVVRKGTTPPDRIPAAAVRATLALRGVSRLGDVVIVRPHALSPPLAVVLVGRRVTNSLFWDYRLQFATKRELRLRDRAVRRFFGATSRKEALEAARALNAHFLMLRSWQHAAFDPRSWFDVAFEEGGERVYRIPTES